LTITLPEPWVIPFVDRRRRDEIAEKGPAIAAS
jgi:hypothetical protein